MTSLMSNENEEKDAKKVDQAIEMISAGQGPEAHKLLTEVIKNTPEDYDIKIEKYGNFFIRFWDQAEFVHYVNYGSEEKDEGDIAWIPNTYPRAFYFIGFLYMQIKDFPKAIAAFIEGQRLDPGHPMFHLEKAQAYYQMGAFDKALSEYEMVKGVGPRVSEGRYAAALRGRGIVHIETGDLDSAEALLKESLEYDPGNNIALHELGYIDHLRKGRHTGQSTMVEDGDGTLRPEYKEKPKKRKYLFWKS